jgi:hypothetical protein
MIFYNNIYKEDKIDLMMATKNLKRVIKVGCSLAIVIDNKIAKSIGIKEGDYILYNVMKIYDENMDEKEEKRK